MAAPEVSGLEQTAVMWAALDDDRYGDATVDDPMEVDVRWNTVHRQTTDANGNTVLLDAEVVVDRRIPVGSLMALGTLADWPGTDLNVEDNELMEVVVYEETPDIKNAETFRSVGLKRYRGVTPTTGADTGYSRGQS